jgi:allantoin racemase
MRIRVVVPVLYSGELVEKARDEYTRAARADTELSFVSIPNGTQTIESQFDMALAQPETIRAVIEAARGGIDACIVACFGDPGAAGAKELVSIPVVGEGEAALHFAHLLGYSYTIITVEETSIPIMKNMTRLCALGERLASVRAVPFGVMDFSLACVNDVVRESVSAVRDDGADVIVMGCTGTGVDMAVLAENRLREELGVYVPVVDPVKAAISLAQGLVASGLAHSKRAYPTPVSERPEYQYHTPSISN